MDNYQILARQLGITIYNRAIYSCGNINKNYYIVEQYFYNDYNFIIITEGNYDAIL